MSKIIMSRRILTNINSLRCCQCAFRLQNNSSIYSASQLTRKYSNERVIAPNEDDPEIDTHSVELEEMDESNVEIELLRDVSRMRSKVRNRMAHVSVPPSEEELDRDSPVWRFRDAKYLKKHQAEIFARYGYKSGIDPGVMWPSREELAEKIADEKQYDMTLQEMWAILKSEKDQQERIDREKDDAIAAKMAKMPQILNTYRKRLEKEGAAVQDAEEKQREFLEKARNHFGYTLDKKDERLMHFKKSLSETERDQKRLEMKEQKDKQKAASKAKFQALSSKTSESSSVEDDEAKVKG